MEKLYDYLPQQLVTFILVTLFSLLIGLSQRRISLKREGETTLFGTDRTFTFIGILGYLLYILDPKEMHLFMGGGIILGMLLGINYYVKQSQFHVFGVTTIIIALITYCMAPIISTQPSWFYVMMVVTVLLFTEMKHTFTELVQHTSADSVLQICGNEETFDLQNLYRCCEIARKITLKDEWRVGRVIARPYVGKKKGEFVRTSNRHDYALKPTVL